MVVSWDVAVDHMIFKLSRMCYFTELLCILQEGKGNDVRETTEKRSSHLQVVLVPHADLRVHRVQLLLLWLQSPCVLCLLLAVHWLAPAVQKVKGGHRQKRLSWQHRLSWFLGGLQKKVRRSAQHVIVCV